MREYLTKFKNDFNSAFINTLNYNQIKDKVVIPVIRKNVKTFSLKYRFVSMLLFILILGGVFLMVATNRVIYRDGGEILVDINKAEESVVWADYIFIGKVDKKLYTRQYDGSGYQMPYTYYSVEVIKHLKPNHGEDNIKMLFYGGYDFLNNLIVFEENDVLPESNEYYIFIARRTNTSNTNKRAEENSFYINYRGQMQLLGGYNPLKSFETQSMPIQKIIQKYLEALKSLEE